MIVVLNVHVHVHVNVVVIVIVVVKLLEGILCDLHRAIIHFGCIALDLVFCLRIDQVVVSHGVDLRLDFEFVGMNHLIHSLMSRPRPRMID